MTSNGDYCHRQDLHRPPPGQQASQRRWHRAQQRAAEIAICDQCQICSALPGRDEIKGYASDKKRDWKVNEHHVLCVLGEDGCTRIPGIHRYSSLAWQVRWWSAGRPRPAHPSIPLRAGSRGAPPSHHIPCTMTFAVIFGWIEQKYVYMPGLAKVKVNFSSVSSACDLKVVLSSLTTVCGISS